MLPNGLSTGPRLFTKLLKPPFAHLRAKGHTILGYIDDTIIIESSKQAVVKSVSATTELLASLGFIIHPEKSNFTPVQEIRYLGFIVNSIDMTVKLPVDKAKDIKDACVHLMTDLKPSIRQVARVIGKLVSAFPGVQYGQLYYRYIERDKINALKQNKGHFDRPMTLSEDAKIELQWWIKNVESSVNFIRRPSPTVEIRTDASGAGWGATNLHTHTGGRWYHLELLNVQNNDINYLELLAAFFGLQGFL